jgi:hypothetical protein
MAALAAPLLGANRPTDRAVVAAIVPAGQTQANGKAQWRLLMRWRELGSDISWPYLFFIIRICICTCGYHSFIVETRQDDRDHVRGLR